LLFAFYGVTLQLHYKNQWRPILCVRFHPRLQASSAIRAPVRESWGGPDSGNARG
jgi:hypothetical protein